MLSRLGRGIVLLALFLVPQTLVPQTAAAQQELANESQNPIGKLISLPLENNISFKEGPEDATVYSLTAKPVYPMTFGDWNLINRSILPFIYQGERFEGEGSQTGLGDLTYQAFFSPVAASPIIWGAGPAFIFPTHTDDRLGTDKWSAGPAFVALAKPGPWLFGGLGQHFWSYAGDDDEDNVNLSSFQYFINYNFDSGWYLSSTPTITANWAADSGDRWTVPFGAGLGRLVKFGERPIDMRGQLFWNAERPDGTSELAFQFQVKFLFPK